MKALFESIFIRFFLIDLDISICVSDRLRDIKDDFVELASRHLQRDGTVQAPLQHGSDPVTLDLANGRLLFPLSKNALLRVSLQCLHCNGEVLFGDAHEVQQSTHYQLGV